MTKGVQLGYSGIATLTEELKLFPPTFLFAVPRVFEKVFNGARAQAGGGLKTKIFDRAADVSIAFSTQEQAGKVSAFTKAQHRLFDKLVYSKLRAAMGGKVRYAISGGAPLGVRLGNFFNGLGPAGARGLRPHRDHRGRDGQHARPPQDRHGRPPGARHDRPHRRRRRGAGAGRDRVRRLLRQRRGHRPRRCRTTGSTPATSASSTPTASSRSPAARRTSSSPRGGKNVQPAELEDRLQANPLVGMAMVVGDNKPFIAALVALDPDELRAWAKEHGKVVPESPAALVSALATDPEIRASVQKTVDEANAAGVARREHPGVPHPADRAHGGERRAHAVAEGQAQGGAGQVRRRDRVDLRQLRR